MCECNSQIEELTSLKRNKPSKSKQKPSKFSLTSREELQSTSQRYDKKFKDLFEEFNTKTGISYKIIEDSDRPNKLKVLYQQTVHLLEEEVPKQLQRRNKLVPYQAKFAEEHLKEARKCKASLDYHWLSYISKVTLPAMNAEQKETGPPKKRDVSDWASGIDILLKPERSAARFQVTPEVNKHSHFSRYRSSRDRSSNVEDRDVSTELVYDTTLAIQVVVIYQC